MFLIAKDWHWRQAISTCSIFLGSCVALLGPAPEAKALEEVRLSYNGFQFSTLSVQELADFSATGEASDDIQVLLDVINVDQASAIALLNNKTIVDNALLEEAAYTFMGESFLQLIGTAIKLPDTQEQSWTYLREAIIASAVDNQVSMIELLQEFPAESVIIDTERAGQVIDQVQKDLSTLQEFLAEAFS